MNDRFSIYALVFFTFLTLHSSSQKISPENFNKLVAFEKSALRETQQILYGENDDEKSLANEIFKQELKKALSIENSILYPFDSLKSISILASQDKQIRIFTWNLPLSDGTYNYFGFVQKVNKQTKAADLFQLAPSPSNQNISEYKKLKHTNWLGCLYYKIIDIKRKGKTYYTLLGWKGSDRLITKKVIDVIHFDRKGVPFFGDAVFTIPKARSKYRIIFQYSAEVSMSINYEPKEKTIIFDHLSPSNSIYKGNYEFYGPDLSFDALVLKKGKWLYVEDYDARLPNNLKDRFFEMKLDDQKEVYRQKE